MFSSPGLGKVLCYFPLSPTSSIVRLSALTCPHILPEAIILPSQQGCWHPVSFFPSEELGVPGFVSQPCLYGCMWATFQKLSISGTSHHGQRSSLLGLQRVNGRRVWGVSGSMAGKRQKLLMGVMVELLGPQADPAFAGYQLLW